MWNYGNYNDNHLYFGKYKIRAFSIAWWIINLLTGGLLFASFYSLIVLMYLVFGLW